MIKVLDGIGGKTTTTLLSNYETVLSALIAKNNNENNKFIEKCKECDIKKQSILEYLKQ